MNLEVLPFGTLETVCSFLTGFDVFVLSHTNSWWLHYFLDGSTWRNCFPRLISDDQDFSVDGQIWKQQYMMSRSMVFFGLPVDEDKHEADSFALLSHAVPGLQRQRFHLTRLSPQSFSFDVWFSLLPSTSDKHLGGIIYGLQSRTRRSGWWPNNHQQFVVVSSTGDLYCSVLSLKTEVATGLECNRWYHLALTYDYGLQQQVVYLDGAKVRSDIGQLHHEWRDLTEEQVGTGCVTAGYDDFPRPGYIGWYGFYGVIDDFRIWKGVLSQEDVSSLAAGGMVSEDRLHAAVRLNTLGTLAGSSAVSWDNVHLISCTRPAERTLILHDAHRS